MQIKKNVSDFVKKHPLATGILIGTATTAIAIIATLKYQEYTKEWLILTKELAQKIKDSNGNGYVVYNTKLGNYVLLDAQVLNKS